MGLCWDSGFVSEMDATDWKCFTSHCKSVSNHFKVTFHRRILIVQLQSRVTAAPPVGGARGQKINIADFDQIKESPIYCVLSAFDVVQPFYDGRWKHIFTHQTHLWRCDASSSSEMI